MTEHGRRRLPRSTARAHPRRFDHFFPKSSPAAAIHRSHPSTPCLPVPGRLSARPATAPSRAAPSPAYSAPARPPRPFSLLSSGKWCPARATMRGICTSSTTSAATWLQRPRASLSVTSRLTSRVSLPRPTAVSPLRFASAAPVSQDIESED